PSCFLLSLHDALPILWGAEGPTSYDCSGLTSQAWAAAGRPIPRTSQEQWRLLPHIAIKDMRPGDLIIYHADATHVGMYVGNGQRSEEHTSELQSRFEL